MGEVLSEASLEQKLEQLRDTKKIVFTNGCFDILHVGHVRYLKEAKSLGDILVVGMDTDASVRLLKGPTRPIQSESDRAEILSSLSSVDYICHFGDGNPLPLIEKVRPDYLVKGGDWPIEKIVGHQFVQSYGGVVKSLAFTEGRSTTKIVEKSHLQGEYE